MISYSLFYFSFFSLFFSSIHFFFFFSLVFSPPHTYTNSPLYLQLFHFFFSTSLQNTQQLSFFLFLFLFLFLLSLSSLLFLFFYFFYSWKYIVNFSPHISCIILQLHGPSQTKVHNMKNLIRERERERASEEKKPNGSLSLSLSLSLIVLISFGLLEKKLFLCLDCVLYFVAVEIEKREREWGKRKKIFFFFYSIIWLF